MVTPCHSRWDAGPAGKRIRNKRIVISKPNTKKFQEIVEETLRFEPALKLELSDKKTRTFSAYRMCWSGECDWMFLDSGRLEKLVKALAPHIEQESFFELF